jgi:hypothetical protein
MQASSSDTMHRSRVTVEAASKLSKELNAYLAPNSHYGTSRLELTVFTSATP